MVTLKDIFDVDYPVSEAVVKRVMGLVREMNVSKRTFIIEQGQPTDSLFFIIDGLVRCVHTRGGEEETFLFATSGDPFTSIHSMSRGEPSQFSWQALDDTRLLALKFSDFEKLLAEEPEIHCWWSKALLDELYVLERRYVWIGNDSAAQRYETLVRTRPDVINRVPVKYIAQYLHISPATLSRIRASLVGNAASR